MKVVFVYIDFTQGVWGEYNEGIASLSGVLKHNNHATDLFHITEGIDCERFLRIFRDKYSEPDIAAFSSPTNTFHYAAAYAAALKKQCDILTICGGPHPTLHPEEASGEPGFDIICVGEGEYPLLELCQGLQAGRDISEVQNLWVKKQGHIFRNPVRPLVEDLDVLALPDHALFDHTCFADHKNKRLAFMCSRGCVFDGSYYNGALKNIYPNPAGCVRFKSVDRILSEIKQVLQVHKEVASVIFHDDILTLNKPWFKEFAERFLREINLPYACRSRFDLLDEQLCEQLRQSGCWRLEMDLGSGDSYIRSEILKENRDEQHILKMSDLCHKIGLDIYLFTMVGLPFENPRRALNTIKLSAKIKPKVCQTSIFYPQAKTSLYELCEKEGFLAGNKPGGFLEGQSVLKLPEFSKRKILFSFGNFQRTYYYYGRIYKFPSPRRYVFEKTLDFLWLHPRLYNVTEPFYRFFKKTYKYLCGRSGADSCVPRYNPRKYWKNRHAKYGMDLRGVGNCTLSSEENERAYREAKRIFLQLCDREGVRFETVQILDVGCGTGFYAQAFFDHGGRQYLGLDITDNFFNILRSKFPDFKFQTLDISRQELPGCFDFIIMIDVTQHIVAKEGFSFAMQNIRSHLNDGGIFMVTSWLSDKLINRTYYEVARPLGYYRREFPGYDFSEPIAFRDKFIFSIKKSKKSY